MKKLLCITGSDGSGKTTLIDALCERMGTAVHSHIWKLLSKGQGLPFRSKTDIDNFLCGLTPDSRLLFLAHALKYAVDTDLDSGADPVILNGYYYKYFASELALGASPALVQDLISSFPVPDKVFYLDYPLKDAAGRKPAFSRYECGLSVQPDMQSFLAFQEKCLAEWTRFNRDGWIIIDGRLDLEAKLDILKNHIGS